MANYSERMIESSTELGRANQVVLELARRHCLNMEFTESGGRGLVEQMTGLPINARRVSCPYALGRGSAMDLEWVATDFYNENCVGCEFRRPTGEVPNLASMLEQKQAASEGASAEAQERLELERAKWAARDETRRSLTSATDPAMSSALDDIRLLDGEPGRSIGEEDRDGAKRRLVALAERAPRTFTEPVIDHALMLVNDVNVVDLLRPLRVLARTRESLSRRVLLASLSVLRRGANEDAGACVVEFVAQLRERDLDSDSLVSLVLLAAAPRDRFPWAGPGRTNDPAGLRAAADVAPLQVRSALTDLIPQPEQAPKLHIPGRDSGRLRSAEPAGDYLRVSASNAVGVLASTHAEISIDLIDRLILSMAVDSDDFHEDQPIHAASRSLATMLVLGVGDVPAKLNDAGERAGAIQRERLFDVFRVAARLIDPLDRWREPGDPQVNEESRRAMFDKIADVCLVRVGGDWGTDIAFRAADVLSDLARSEPKWVGAHLDGLLGGFLSVLDQLEPAATPSLEVVDETPPEVRAMTEVSRRTRLGSTARELLDAVESVSNVDPQLVCQRLIALIDVERATDQGPEIRWRVLRRLGSIGRQHGGSPEVLSEILPVLHGYLVDNEPGLRAAALDAWVEIARKHTVPSSLADLLPVLLEDKHVVVIASVLKAAYGLQWTSEDLNLLLPYTFYLCAVADPDESTEVLKRTMTAVRTLTRNNDDLRLKGEMLRLSRAQDLGVFDLEDALRGEWLPEVHRSPEMTALRLQLARDPRINDRINQGDDDELCALLDSGAGLITIPLPDLIEAAVELGPESVLAAAEFAEVLWRAGRLGEAVLLMQGVLEEIPDEPAFGSHRALSQLIEASAAVDAAAADGVGLEEAYEELRRRVAAIDEPGESVAALLSQIRARSDARMLFSGTESSDTSGDARTASDPVSARNQVADQFRAVSKELQSLSQRDTPTARYMLSMSALCEIGGHLTDLDAAELSADGAGAAASLRAAKRHSELLVESLVELVGEADPICGPLEQAVREVFKVTSGSEVGKILGRWTRLPMPLLIVEGPRRSRSSAETSTESPADAEELLPPDVAVVLVSIDGRPVTGPQVLESGYVYSLQLDIRPGEWPDWADRLDAEFLGHLTQSEITLPSFSWLKADMAATGGTLSGSGSMVLRFSLPAGQPAPPFLVSLHWRGEREGLQVSEELEVAGHRQLRVRPFDHSRDFLTDYQVFDERLLSLYEGLHNAGYREEEIRAFCRLLTSLSRAGLRMTWDQDYKRGSSITEREFQEDLFARLESDPELEGRVRREVPIGLGYADIWHDGITAELKVERRRPVTKETAPKYMGQATQYASAGGARLSILCILDMSPKELPVGVPENYLFTLQPSLHGLDNPEAPSLVATLVVNGNLPPPSSWSR